MAATNFTPIILYHTTTASAAPTAGNLNNGELAINITDGKLFYKDNGGTVQVIATKGTGTIGGSTTQVQYNNAGALAGSANFTFNGTTATINTLNLTNALGTTYGGTGLNSYTTGDVVYASGSNTLAKLAIGANTYILTSTGSVPQWSAPSSVTVSTATNLAGGAAGSVPYQSGASTTTFLSIGTANTVMTSSGTAPQWSSSLTLGGNLVVNGNTTLGDAAADNLTVNATITSNLIFTDNTYDIGASGATRPRTIYAGTSIFSPLVDTTNLEVTNIKALDGTAAASIANGTGVISITANPVLSGGTANGVAYLNGSKVLTTGSALTFDGTNFGVGTSSYGNAGTINAAVGVPGTTTGGLQLWSTTTTSHYVQFGDGTTGDGPYRGAVGYNHSLDALVLYAAGAEKASLTSTGLGVGTSPSYALDVKPSSAFNVARFTGQASSVSTYIYTDTAYWAFGDGTSYTGQLYGGHAINKTLSMYTDSVERVIIGATGTLTIVSGGLNLGSGGANGYISGGTWYGISSGDWNFQAGNASQNFVWKNSSGSNLARITSAGSLLVGTTANNYSASIIAADAITTTWSGTIGLRYNVSGQTNAYYKGMTGTSIENSTARGLHIFNYDQDSNSGINFYPNSYAGQTANAAVTITSAGDVGIATSSPGSRLDVVKQGNSSGGTLLLSGSKTNNGVKYGYLAGTQYASDAEPEGVGIIGLTSTSTVNTVSIGGGIDEMNTATSIQFYTASSTTQRGSANERMRITGTGSLLLGNTTSCNWQASSAGHITFTTATATTDNAGDSYRAGIGWQSGTSGDAVLSALITAETVATYSANLLFLIRNTGGGNFVERARVTSGGYFKASNNGSYGGGNTASFHDFTSTTGDEYAIRVYNTSATLPYGIQIKYSAASPNGNLSVFLEGSDSTTQRFAFRSNGGLANYSANDVNLSDRREKINFAPAKSYLDTICAIPVQTFNYIDQSEDDPGLTLGVVAQDVQAVAPELVAETNWGTKDNPKMRLSIYQTDLQYALMKALQELKAEFDAYKASHP